MGNIITKYIFSKPKLKNKSCNVNSNDPYYIAWVKDNYFCCIGDIIDQIYITEAGKQYKCDKIVMLCKGTLWVTLENNRLSLFGIQKNKNNNFICVYQIVGGYKNLKEHGLKMVDFLDKKRNNNKLSYSKMAQINDNTKKTFLIKSIDIQWTKLIIN